MAHEEDKYIVERLIANDAEAIEDFFFYRCRAALTYIGQYFCQSKESAESLIGEFYEYLADNDWHKLRAYLNFLVPSTHTSLSLPRDISRIRGTIA